MRGGEAEAARTRSVGAEALTNEPCEGDGGAGGVKAAGAAKDAESAEGARPPVVSERFDDLGASGLPVRLGLMGGTFDPVHLGHLSCAERALEECKLDAVLFIPAGNPTFKQGKQQASGAERLALCKLAVAGNPAFDVSAMEIERGGVTYAVDTLRALRAHYPENVELFYIVGIDAALYLDAWKEADEVARLARFVVVDRPGLSFDSAALEGLIERGFRIDCVRASGFDVSSSDVRERAAAGRSLRYLVPEAVRRHIAERGLYASCAAPRSGGNPDVSEDDILSDGFYEARREELRGRVGKRRFAHIEGVAETCERLARAYGVDVRRARLAGLLHDWDKGYDDEGIRARAAELNLAVNPWIAQYQARLLHGPTAAAAFARDWAHMPADVLHAIEWHTTATTNMSALDMVLYVADALEPTRTFDRADEFRAQIGVVPLEDLFVQVLGYWTVLIIERGKTMHPATAKVWNHYAMKNEKPYVSGRCS